MMNFQTGLTIVELMVSLTLGVFVILAASALLISSKNVYVTIDDTAMVQDAGRYALEIIARSVHQTSYVNWESDEVNKVTNTANGADIQGLDAHSLHSTTPNIDAPIPKSINGSDVLAVRHFGSGAGENGDGTILNCAGFGVPAVKIIESVEEERGWNIFYVAPDASGEPELRCKYRGKTSWSSGAIARGVESFQVLYGIDTDADGMPDQYISANVVDELDKKLELVGSNVVAREIDKCKKTNWKKVVAIKVALLIRGTQKARFDALVKQYDLFGTDYSNLVTSDVGVSIKEEAIHTATRNRVRMIFQQTIIIRNQQAGIRA